MENERNVLPRWNASYCTINAKSWTEERETIYIDTEPNHVF